MLFRSSAKPKAKKPEVERAIEPLIVHAALELAAQEGWDAVSSSAVAKRAGVKLEEIHAICPDKIDILRLLGDELNIAMLEGGEVDGEVRDNLFELIMRRLELLQQHREGVLAVVTALKRDPAMALKLAGEFNDTLGHILAMAGVSASPLHRAGLAALELAVFKAWCEDESADLAATMAELDRRLGQLEQLAQTLEPLLKRAA